MCIYASECQYIQAFTWREIVRVIVHMCVQRSYIMIRCSRLTGIEGVNDIMVLDPVQSARSHQQKSGHIRHALHPTKQQGQLSYPVVSYPIVYKSHPHLQFHDGAVRVVHGRPYGDLLQLSQSGDVAPPVSQSAVTRDARPRGNREISILVCVCVCVCVCTRVWGKGE